MTNNKPYGTRTLAVRDYGKVTTIEFADMAHWASVTGGTLKSEYHWIANGGFRSGKAPALSFKDAIATAQSGLPSLIAPSDDMIDKLESMLPDMALKAFEITRSIVGSCPDVPSLLAGEPLTMLQRRRRLKQEAPLAVFIDLISTCNVTDKQHMTKGAAILALVRILSTRRPVTLFAGMQCDTQGSAKRAAMLYFPMDTSPLDLARAAWLMSHQSAVRGMMYQFCKQEVDYRGHWAWNDSDKHRDRGQDVARAVLGCNEILYIPPPMTQDRDFQTLVNDPARWLVERVMRYGKHGIGEEDAA